MYCCDPSSWRLEGANSEWTAHGNESTACAVERETKVAAFIYLHDAARQSSHVHYAISMHLACLLMFVCTGDS